MIEQKSQHHETKKEWLRVLVAWNMSRTDKLPLFVMEKIKFYNVLRKKIDVTYEANKNSQMKRPIFVD